jgi:hypothetical protein
MVLVLDLLDKFFFTGFRNKLGPKPCFLAFIFLSYFHFSDLYLFKLKVHQLSSEARGPLIINGSIDHCTVALRRDDISGAHIILLRIAFFSSFLSFFLLPTTDTQ